MSYLLYFVPVVLILGGLVYSQLARRQALANVAAGVGGQQFHDYQSQYFDQLGSRERIIAIWQGKAYNPSRGAAGEVLNAVSAHAIGISTYVPNVIVALTTDGRLMVAEEYSELGERGHFKTALVLPAGARAITGPGAGLGDGSAPKNPFNPLERLVAAAIQAPDGTLQYQAWLSPVGLGCAELAQPMSSVLPMDAKRGARIWSTVNPAEPTL
ncbi:MAG: hypothetical protein QM784_33130 [Polyangiaceae bacterium]